jgi:two-component system chemotaxis family response regulator WspR
MDDTEILRARFHALSERYECMVLLVDDQTLIAEAVRRALDGEPHMGFHFCINSLDAVAIASEIKPTVILQDLVMPGVNGLSLVRQYRTNPATRDIPIIVLSSREEPLTKSEAFASGANDYLVKLPDKVELIARVRYHSRAYLNQLQRDEAYRALRESQQLLMEKNIELERLTNVDGLTGMSNRRYLDESTEIQWRQAIRDQTSFAVLMIDIDDFKRYNDTYGHVAGDEVLKSIARSMQQVCSRPADLAARFGGEEFIVCLPLTPLEGAALVAEKIRSTVEEQHFGQQSSGVGTTVSVGCAAMIPQQGDSFLALIETADQALYQAKHSGKNRVVTKPHHKGIPSAACSEPHSLAS